MYEWGIEEIKGFCLERIQNTIYNFYIPSYTKFTF